jgi:hypothetical protein
MKCILPPSHNWIENVIKKMPEVNLKKKQKFPGLRKIETIFSEVSFFFSYSFKRLLELLKKIIIIKA